MVTFSVDGDGNCMAHSISRAISGVEVFFHVLRTELLAELRENVEFYRDRSIESGFYTEDEWERDLESAGPSQMGQAGMWMSGMHIFGMANVLRRPIFLVDARQNASVIEPDLMVVQQLVDMGFTQHAAVRAAISCQNRLDECMPWLLDHEQDPMLNEPMDTGPQRVASASAKGGLFLPLRFTPEECKVEGVMPSPLMIACANAEASHFCAVVTVADSQMTEDGVLQLDWTVPEGAEGGKQFSDTMEVNGELIGFSGVVPADAVPGDVIKLSIGNGPGGPNKPGKVSMKLKQKLKQNSGLQQRQLSSAIERIVEDGRAIIHALSVLLTGQRCEPELEETEQLYEGYMNGRGKEPINVVFVNTEAQDLTMRQVMVDGSVAKSWPLNAYGQGLITTPIGAHFRMFNAQNERVFSITITDQHADDDMIMVDASERVAAPALDPRSLDAIKCVVQALGAIVAKPDQPKPRKLPLANKAVSERMLPVDGVRELLTAVGFVEETIDGKQCLHIPEQHLDTARLQGVLVTLRSALGSGIQHPHPLQYDLVILPAVDADAADGGELQRGDSGESRLAGGRTASAQSGGSGGDSSWSDVDTRASIIRRHVVEVSGGLQLLEKAGGFTGVTAQRGGGGGGGSGSDRMCIRLEAADLRSGLRSLEELNEAQTELLAVSGASQLPFGLDEEAFGQIQFTQQMCDANDWDFARRYANGDGCWELGCGKQGGEATAEAMEDARTKFSRLLQKDFRGAMRKRVPVTCTECQAALVVSQYQIESTKGRMLEIGCPQCGAPVPLTAPTLHEEIQAALNREAGTGGEGEEDAGGRGHIMGLTSSSGSMSSRSSSGGGTGAGYVLGRAGQDAGGGSAGDAGGDTISMIGSITRDPAPRSSAAGAGSGSSSRHEPEPERQPEPGEPEEGDVFLIQLPKREMTEAERFVRRQFEQGKAGAAAHDAAVGAGGIAGGDGGGGTSEFDQVLDTLRREAKHSDSGSVMLTGRLLDLATNPSTSDGPTADDSGDGGDGAALGRNLSVGSKPTGGPLLAHTRLVAELCGDGYGFTRSAVNSALKQSQGNLFKALDVLEGVPPQSEEDGEAPRAPLSVGS